MESAPASASELIGFGWQIAESTLAEAQSELRLVTHWFLTPEDSRVNADDHFGSDERTLRFLGVALPTLIDQLGATAAVVALPWGLDDPQTTLTLTVIGVGFGAPAQLETRALTRLSVEPGPPFWRLEPDRLGPPSPFTAIASGLAGDRTSG